jgi:hypothetical protein
MPRSAHGQLYVNQDANPSSQVVESSVGEYNATTGAAINANFITGLSEPGGVAVAGNDLFVANFSTRWSASSGTQPYCDRAHLRRMSVFVLAARWT